MHCHVIILIDSCKYNLQCFIIPVLMHPTNIILILTGLVVDAFLLVSFRGGVSQERMPLMPCGPFTSLYILISLASIQERE